MQFLPADWEAVKYEKLIPHDLETTPLELKLDITNNKADVSFCLMFVPDEFDLDVLDELSWITCIGVGSNTVVTSNFCENQQEIPYQNSQFKDGVILWNVTKTEEKLQFQFEVLGKIEHPLEMYCDFDITWVLFIDEYPEGTLKEVNEDRLFYKSSIPGKY